MEYEVKIEFPKSIIYYVATDGKKFENSFECEIYDRPLRRKQYRDWLIKNHSRLWVFFNINSYMRFYDKLQLK